MRPFSVQGFRKKDLQAPWFTARRADARQRHGGEYTGKLDTSCVLFPQLGVLWPCALDALIGLCASWTFLSLLLLLLCNQTLLN